MEISFKNIPVSYSDSGSGDAIVFLHGFLENKEMWSAFVPALASKHRVITIDLLGHGGTGCIGYVHKMEDNAELVHKVLTELGIKQAVFAGHSMGGYVALAFAELHPKMVTGMMLINSTAKEDSDERKANRDRAIAAVKQNYTSFVRMSVGNLFAEKNREKLAERIELIKAEALKTPLQGIVASLEGMKIRKDRQHILKKRKFPVMIVLGEKDEVLNLDETREMAKLYNLETVVFPDGHMSSVENESELKTVMADFLKSIN